MVVEEKYQYPKNAKLNGVFMQYYSNDGEKYDSTENQVRRIATSTVIFIIAFIVTQTVYQFVTAIIAQSLGYICPWNFSDILLTQDFHAWNVKRILVVCMVPIVIFFLIGMLAFYILKRDKSRLDSFWLFFFWVMVCAANIFFANIILAPIGVNNYASHFYVTFAAVGAWLGLPQVLMVLISIVTAVTCVAFGGLIQQLLMRFSFSRNLLQTQQGRNSIAFQLFLLPLVLGILPLSLLGDGQEMFHLAAIIAVMFLMALGIFVMNTQQSNVKSHKEDVLNSVPYKAFGFSAALWSLVFWFLR